MITRRAGRKASQALLLGAVLTCMVVPQPAQASVAYLNDEGLAEAHGGPGEANHMTVRAGGDGVVFADAAGVSPRTEGSGCRALSGTEVTCIGEGGLLFGEDGNDTLRDLGVAGGFHARGGPGNDVITAAGAPAILYGDDRTVQPTDGDDRIVGSSAAAPVQSPNFHDLINGGGGDDAIDAGAGDDHASGQAGNDTVHGGAGKDVLDNTSLLRSEGGDAPGDAGNDTLTGGEGADQLDAIRGRDKANGGPGNDLLRAVDADAARDDHNSDDLTCGTGRDQVAAGRNDRVVMGCEMLLVPMYCAPRYPCKVIGHIAGRARRAKGPRVIARLSRTLRSPKPVAFSLGRSAKRLLGSAKRIGLTAEVTARRGRTIAGGARFRFTLLRSG